MNGGVGEQEKRGVVVSFAVAPYNTALIRFVN